MIENYVKNVKNVNSEDIKILYLPQSKSYLKIIGIPYFIENILITSDFVTSIIKVNHIFNNLLLVLKLQVIKILPKSDIAIMWLNIWNAQSSYKAKNLINRCFNVESYIVTI